MAKFIIIGLTPQGLSMLRVLSRAGHKVIAFTNTKKAVGYYSKYGIKKIFANIDDLKKKIEQITDNETEKIKCIITSGELLALIIEEYPELYEICEVESGPFELIKMLSHKNKMYEFAQSRGLKCAKYKLLSEYKPGDLQFPVILKRNYEIPLFFKIKKIESEQELSFFSDKINKKNYKHVLVQEYINTNNYVFITHQVYLHNGNILGSYVGNQKRRLATGLTCFLEEINDENLKNKIKDNSERFLSMINYSGFIEFEYIIQPVNFDVIFMETNTRPCGTHSVLNYKFENFEEIFNNLQSPPHLIENKKNIIWINIVRDIRARIIYKDFKNLSQFFTAKKDIFDWHDLKPFVMQFFK